MTAEEMRGEGVRWTDVEAGLSHGDLVLRIVDWSEKFETAESRKLMKLHEFYKAPPGTESAGYKELTQAGTEGILAMGVFMGLCQAFSQQPKHVRKTNRWFKKTGNVMDLRRIAAELRMPTLTVLEALQFLCQEDVRWCEIDRVESLSLSDLPLHESESPKSLPNQSHSVPDLFLTDSQPPLKESKSKSKSKIEEKEKTARGAGEEFLKDGGGGMKDEDSVDEIVEVEILTDSATDVSSLSLQPSALTKSEALSLCRAMIRGSPGLNGHGEEFAAGMETWLSTLYRVGKSKTGKALHRELERGLSLAGLSDRHAEAVIEDLQAAAQNRKDDAPDPWLMLKWKGASKLKLNPNPNNETLTRSATTTNHSPTQDHAKGRQKTRQRTSRNDGTANANPRSRPGASPSDVAAARLRQRREEAEAKKRETGGEDCADA